MKVMKLTVFTLSVVLAFAFIALSGGETKKLPEGVELKADDHAVAKPGYAFYRFDNRSAGVKRKAGKSEGTVVKAMIWCECTEGNGECVVRVLDQETVKCQWHGECKKCRISTKDPRETKIVM